MKSLKEIEDISLEQLEDAFLVLACHALYAEAVGGGSTGDVGIDIGADINGTLFVGLADHRSYLLINMKSD